MPYWIGFTPHTGADPWVEEFETREEAVRARESAKRDIGLKAAISIPFMADSKEQALATQKLY